MKLPFLVSIVYFSMLALNTCFHFMQEWGAEGYTLWVVNKESLGPIKRNRSGGSMVGLKEEVEKSDSESDEASSQAPMMPYELLQRQLKEEQRDRTSGRGEGKSEAAQAGKGAKYSYRVQFFHMVKSALTANPSMVSKGTKGELLLANQRK